MSPNKSGLTHPVDNACLHFSGAVLLCAAHVSQSVESPLPVLCLPHSLGFVSAKFYPLPVMGCQSHPSISLLRIKQSFNSNFLAGSLVKVRCSFSYAVAVRRICHWQDSLRKNICQTHSRTGADKGSSTAEPAPWDYGG